MGSRVHYVPLSATVCQGLSLVLLYDASDEDSLEDTPVRGRIN
jgi:hypothetical protein